MAFREHGDNPPIGEIYSLSKFPFFALNSYVPIELVSTQAEQLIILFYVIISIDTPP